MLERITLAVNLFTSDAVIRDENGIPTAIRLLDKGLNKTTKGDLIFDDSSAKSVATLAADYGNDFHFDYEHALFDETNTAPDKTIAAGWYSLEVKPDGLWAVNLDWTPRAYKYLQDKEYKYFSPSLIKNRKTNVVVEYLNTALTNFPARKNLTPLVLNRGTEQQTAADYRTETYSIALDELIRSLDTQLSALFPDSWIVEVYNDQVVFRYSRRLWSASEPNARINDASKAIVNRLLQALPSRRMVAMRYPLYKQQFYGTEPLSAAEAYSTLPKARMGAHNDCFLASSTDWGTYPEDQTAREALKNYLEADNLYLPQGGETCNIGTDAQPYVGCNNAQSELARLRYSVLNREYLEDVYKLWQSQGCLESVKQRLGYRFRLRSSSFPGVVSQEFKIKLELQNDGYAAPYNPRGVALVLRHNKTNKQTRIVLHNGNLGAERRFDPRFWHTGKHSLETVIRLPSGLETGIYTLYVHLYDPETSLQNRPEYAIRLANQEMWDAQLGFNQLGTLELR